MTTKTDITQERADFETAYASAYPTAAARPDKFDREDWGDYVDASVGIGWRMWQAGRWQAVRAAVEADRREQMNDNAACIAKLSESDKQDQSGGVTARIMRAAVEYADACITRTVAGCTGRPQSEQQIAAMAAEQAYADLHDLLSGQLAASIDIADVRQYLEQWGCLAHPGVRALIDCYSSGQPETGKTVLLKNQEVAGRPAAPSGLGFCIEDRAGVRCIVEDGGGVRPASETECALWDALMSGQPAASAEPYAYIRTIDLGNGNTQVDLIAADIVGDLSQYTDIVSFEPLFRRAAPVAQEPTESVVLLDALSGLVKALRERHYGRMPDEVQAAYDKAWAIVFSSPVAAPVAQEPVAWLRNERGTSSGLATFDPLVLLSEPVDGAFRASYQPLYAAPIAAQAQPTMPALTDAMRAVLRNEHDVYLTEDALYAALCDAAQAQSSGNPGELDARAAKGADHD